MNPNRIIFRVALFFLLLSTQACLGYLYQAGIGQAEILWKRRPISEVLKDPKTPEAIKARLRFVEDVREFARTKIGLNVGETYQTISMLDRDSLAWNVTASRPLAFKEKLYYFPFVGRLPYLGFFDKADAVAHAKSLEAEGWETLLSEVGAYSTLGWFDDPLISTQLNYSKPALANLIIHECSHATIWFPNDVTFNESFASFVGHEGAKEYLQQTWGKKSAVYQKWEERKRLQKELNALFRKTARELEKLYQSGLSDTEKKTQKARIIAGLRSTLSEKYAKRIRPEWLKRQTFNNAFFLSFRRYKSGQTYFQKEYEKCDKNWACFLSWMKQLKSLPIQKRRKLLR